jgi:phosphocarrier protein HPr
MTMAERDVEIHNDVGLHARPATIFTKTAGGFAADVRVATADGEADAKSVLSVLALDIRPGAHFTIRADGQDAEEAVDTLAELVRSWS